MTEAEFETLAILIEHLESAHIIAGTMFDGYANNQEHDKALIFQGLRDRLDIELKTIGSYIEVESEEE